ncbi:hypothetical protein FISHEDRAFT_33194, partial [Fistulina hepatica ATCC 64428]
IIPAMHVEGHVDHCMYAFGSCYKESCRHFHGKTAEHLWPMLNQFCKITRQMAPGGYKDTLVKFQNHWNKQKVGNMGMRTFI